MRHAPLSMVVRSGSGKPATQLQCTVALVKNIVGTGVLTLPAGISRLSDGGASSSDSLTLAASLLLGFGVLNGFGFLLIGEACAATSQKSYVGAWRETLGARTSFIPALTSLFLCFLAAVSCCTVIEDVGTDIIASLSGIDLESLSREGVLVAFSAGVLTPLCLLPSLAPLGSASILGVAGILLTGSSMATRLLDGSYAAPMGTFASDVVAQPAFHDAVQSGSLLDLPPSPGAICFFLSLVSNAYLAHYNAPGVFNECRAAEAAAQGMGGAAGFPDGVLPAVSGGSSVEEEAGNQDDSMDSSTPVLGRLTSTLAAEEVNLQFEQFIESVPSFGVENIYAAGYEDGYRAGYAAAVLDRKDSLDSLPSPLYSTDPLNETLISVPGAPVAAKDVVLRTSSAAEATSDTGLVPFRRVVTSAFSVSSLLFLLIAWCGFSTFGDSSNALILSNYASNDPLASAARIGILLAVLFEFPLLERPFRLTALELLLPIPQFTGAITRISNTPLAAIASVAFISGVAAVGVPLDALAGLGGSTGGALLIYIGPALMTLKLRQQQGRAQEDEGQSILADADGVTTATATSSAPFDLQVLALWSIAAMGVTLAAVGTIGSFGQL